MKRLVLLMLVVSIVAPGLAGCSNAPKQLTLGFVPSKDAAKLAESAEPLAKLLSNEIGIPVKSFISTNYVALVEAMGTKNNPVDIGFLPTFGYVLANQENGAKIILKTSRKGATSYKAQFVVRAGAGIAKVEDLKGKKFAFVDPTSASGYLFPAAFLMAKGINIQKDFDKVVFLGAHDAIVKAVYNNDVQAGVCFEDARTVLEKEFPDVKDKVLVLTYTDPIPNDTVSVRKDLDPALAKKIQDAFIKIVGTPAGKDLLMKIYEIDGFQVGTDADYEVVRRTAKLMNIDLKTGK
jgi:phosphonate transport system substrate-binding protein